MSDAIQAQVCELEGDYTDSLAVEEQRRFFPGHKAKQGADSNQSGIAGSGRATPFIFKIVEAIEDELFFDLFKAKVLDIFIQRIGGIAEQQLNGVSVSENGDGSKALFGLAGNG